MRRCYLLHVTKILAMFLMIISCRPTLLSCSTDSKLAKNFEGFKFCEFCCAFNPLTATATIIVAVCCYGSHGCMHTSFRCVSLCISIPSVPVLKPLH